ncbi:MAG: SidA/IucD/PvdA family monooxygenase [Nitrosomonas sp.]|nr:SidA/IucD/PvdA family monooxygenase [Nitrosomonas sp.]
MKETSAHLNLAGVGIGPFNLSLAALLAPLTQTTSCFFDRRPAFAWHPGMMLPSTRMQTSFLKDLVTPVDPTSPYSFLAYLVAHGRFYRFLHAEFPRVRRAEFADYLRWVSEQLPNLAFDQDVAEIDFDHHGFLLKFNNEYAVRSTNLVIGTGVAPYIPTWAQTHMGARCVHSSHYMVTDHQLQDRRVVVIGGGQSGAEIFLDILSEAHGKPREVTWISRRPNLEPLDETAFTNEYFTPDYVKSFYRQPDNRRDRIVRTQTLAGDGVSPQTLIEISQYLYENDFLRHKDSNHDYRIMTNREVRRMTRNSTDWQLHMHNRFDESDESVSADVVILATGYRQAIPDCLAPLATRFERDSENNIPLTEDYQALWDGPATHRIYMMNAGLRTHGIADPQLSLAAWRAAVIVNSLLDQKIYRTDFAPSPLYWSETCCGNDEENYLAASTFSVCAGRE